MSFSRNTRYTLHCRRSPPTLLPASQKTAHRTVLVVLDQTATFNNVDHQQLLDCVYNTNIPATIRRWFYNYMQNKQAKVHLWQQESKSRNVKTELLQGGVLSPALFNYYLADFPTPSPNIKMTLPSTHPDQWWLTSSMTSTSICRKCSTTSTTQN